MKRILLIIATLMLAALPLQAAANIHLDWDDNPADQNVTEYTVYQSTDNVNFNSIMTVTDSEATINGLAQGVYYFRITASNVWGESSPSNTVATSNAVTPPQGVTITITITIP